MKLKIYTAEIEDISEDNVCYILEIYSLKCSIDDLMKFSFRRVNERKIYSEIDYLNNEIILNDRN